MPKSDQSVRRNIERWTRALSVIAAPAREVTVPASTVLELCDEIFDGPQCAPPETDWFQIDAERCEIFLEDGVSAIRLANRRVERDGRGEQNAPMVSWLGYKSDAYDLESHAPETAPAGEFGGSRHIAWVAWDLRAWRTRLFDGTRLVPIAPSRATAAGYADDEPRAPWIGWDFERMDVFTTQPLAAHAATAVLVGEDNSVLVVRSCQPL